MLFVAKKSVTGKFFLRVILCYCQLPKCFASNLFSQFNLYNQNYCFIGCTSSNLACKICHSDSPLSSTVGSLNRGRHYALMLHQNQSSYKNKGKKEKCILKIVNKISSEVLLSHLGGPNFSIQTDMMITLLLITS